MEPLHEPLQDRNWYPSLEEVCTVIEDYERNTIPKFVVRRIGKSFGAKGQWYSRLFLSFGPS